LLPLTTESQLPVSYQRTLRLNYTRLILPVLYACENWSLTLRAEHKLRAFEKRVLRRISGSKREE
jgi:hypothetical protein